MSVKFNDIVNNQKLKIQELVSGLSTNGTSRFNLKAKYIKKKNANKMLLMLMNELEMQTDETEGSKDDSQPMNSGEICNV